MYAVEYQTVGFNPRERNLLCDPCDRWGAAWDPCVSIRVSGTSFVTTMMERLTTVTKCFNPRERNLLCDLDGGRHVPKLPNRVSIRVSGTSFVTSGRLRPHTGRALVSIRVSGTSFVTTGLGMLLVAVILRFNPRERNLLCDTTEAPAATSSTTGFNPRERNLLCDSARRCRQHGVVRAFQSA